MDISIFDNDIELRNILWACYEQYSSPEGSDANRDFCYTWVNGRYKRKYGKPFHQARLSKLERYGFLKKLDLVRRGRRRYYTLVNPKEVKQLIDRFDL